MQQLEIGFDETNDKLNKSLESLEEKEKHFKEVESDVSALTRRLEQRQRATEGDRDIHRETESDSRRQGHTQRDRGRQRERERGGER